MNNSSIISTSASVNGISLADYFSKIREISKQGEKFPINLDDVFSLVYSRRDKAINELRKNFIEGEDFILHQLGKVLNSKELQNGIKIDAFLSVPAMEYFIAKKVKEVFEVYRKIFHNTLDQAEKPLSTLDFLSAQLELMKDHEAKIKALEEQQSEISGKVDDLINSKQQAQAEFKALPFDLPKEEEPIEFITRDKIRMLVNGYARATDIATGDIWNKIYQELYYKYKVSIRSYKKKNAKESLLDVADRIGQLNTIFVIASNICKI